MKDHKHISCNSCGDSKTYLLAQDDGWLIVKPADAPWEVLCSYCWDRFDEAMAKD